MLDWTDRPSFSIELLQLVTPIDCRLTARSQWMPRGHRSPEEARLETFGPETLPNTDTWQTLCKWWLAYERGANTPNWDIVASCEIEGRPGLILVEAKANVAELSVAGKRIVPTASPASLANHHRIGLAIDEACAALRQINSLTAISRDSHYQLSNRVAFAWKLGSLGVPTILIYLGFWGDTGIVDAGTPFDSAAHWEVIFAQHAHSVVPKDLFERRIDCGASSAWLLVRARPVLEVSPPTPSKALMDSAAMPRS